MKNKTKKRGLSDALYAKKAKGVVKKVNPFELHESREKFDIINRRRNHSLGVPTKSRQIAIDRRKETLGKEFEVKNKSNSFKDARKSGFRVKESIYNLNDSEILTHHGQTLSEIQRFDDFKHEEDDEMSDDELRLDSKFTEAAHFGNFDDGLKDRKTVIDELIAESKKRKQEKAREHEQMLDMTDKLDSEWRELLPVMKNLTKNEENDRQPDEYDRLVKEMIFSPRAEPTEKLKNEEEVARLEKEKLMKLEKERIARMEQEEEEISGEKKIKHKSADDLDDGYFLETEEIHDDKVLAYDINPNDQDDEDNEEEDEADEVEDEVGGEEDDENDQESADDEEDEESDADSLNDLKPDNEENDDDEEAEITEDESEEEQEVEEIPTKVLKISDEPKTREEKPVEKPEKSESKHAELLKSIPFTIAMPLCYEHLEELLGDHPISVQATIVDRIIKTNHPKLLYANKSKMLQLFAFLIQLLNDKFSSDNQENYSKSFKLLKSLVPYLYDIVHMNPAETSNCFVEVIKEKYEEFKKNSRNFPELDTIFLFIILGKIFPTSDFKHSVVTPSYIFIHHIFSQARVKNRSDVARGLLLATLVLEYQEFSKKFMPSVLNFLSGICYLGCDRSSTLNEKPILPFKRSEPILFIQEKISDFDTETKLGCDDFKDTEIDDEFRANALNVNIQLIRDFIHLYQDHVGIHYLIDGQLRFIKFLKEQSNLPKSLKSLIKSISKDFKALKSSKQFIYPKPDKKPTPILRQLEPQFETVLSDRRSMYAEARGGGRQEEKKLQHMVKREFKAAKRELRRDNEFINKMRFKRRQDQDRERQAKVRKIFDQASVQQSEFNKMSKSRARKSKF